MHAWAHVPWRRMEGMQRAEPTERIESAERDRLADALLDASRALLAIAVRSVSAGMAEVTVVQHRVLVLLEARGTLSVSEVADVVRAFEVFDEAAAGAVTGAEPV